MLTFRTSITFAVMAFIVALTALLIADAFIKMWADFNQEQDRTTNDAMEATFIGFRMWAQAVTQAGTADVNAIRQATARACAERL